MQHINKINSYFASFIGLMLLLIMTTTMTQAAYLENISQTLRQPDGTVLNCLASGDEFHNWLHDENNYTIIQDHSTGYYVYARTVNGSVVPSSHIVGIVDPRTVDLRPGVNIDPAEREARRQSLLQELEAHGGAGRAPQTGVINHLVVFIRFSDQPEFDGNTDGDGWTMTEYDNSYNAATGNSLYNYFQEVSSSQLEVFSTFYPTGAGTYPVSYQDSHTRSYFMPYDASTNPDGYQDGERTEREHNLLRDALLFI
ncbi:MAG: hypothetical protein GY869_06420, partial [Planctomycetes bacterium]|nr:hypothetical protein [Planctomycetota bacterium]